MTCGSGRATLLATDCYALGNGILAASAEERMQGGAAHIRGQPEGLDFIFHITIAHARRDRRSPTKARSYRTGGSACASVSCIFGFSRGHQT